MKSKKAIIYCKNIENGRLAYYMCVDQKDYFLFIQNYRRSNYDFFGMGVLLDDALDYSVSRSTSVHNTMARLVTCIKYIETEYGLMVLRKTQKSKSFRKNLSYNRQKFKANFYKFDAA